jgi:hypothetical protein
MNSRFVTALALLASLLGARALPAAPTVEELAKLFAAGEKNTTPSVEAARQIARALKRANRDDLRIDYSFGLVLANQRRYAEAQPLLTRYVAAHSNDWTAHTVKVWNEMQAGQMPAALESMTGLATLLGQSAADDPNVEQLAAAQFMGSCLAFLDRTPQKHLDDQAIAGQVAQIRSVLGKRYQPAFDKGWQSVTAQAEAMLAAQNERIDREQEKAVQKERQINDGLKDTAEQIAVQREKGQSSLDAARNSERELQNIRQQFASLSQDRALVGAQIVTIQAQITTIQSNPIVISRGASATSSVSIDNGTTRAANSLSGGVGIESIAQLQTLSVALANLNRQAFDMDRLLMGLQARGAELAGISQVEFKKLSESQAAAEKAAKRAQSLSKQLDRPESTTAKHASTTARLARFATFAPLPYEQETNRVLGWFEK